MIGAIVLGIAATVFLLGVIVIQIGHTQGTVGSIAAGLVTTGAVVLAGFLAMAGLAGIAGY